MLDIIMKYVIYFFIYAVFGWCCEVVYCSIPKKKFVNRGFCYGPLCPIYGFGGIGVVLLLYPIREYWYIVVILGCLITSGIEYLTSYIMEKMFHLRWWDYSHYKFNINGRVCLLNSTLFTLLVCLIVYIVHPLVYNMVELIPLLLLYILAIVLTIVFLTDTTISCIHVGKFNKLLEKCNVVFDDVKGKCIILKQDISKKYNELKDKAIEEKDKAIEKINNIKIDVEDNYNGEFSKYIYYRIIEKFPKISSPINKEKFELLKDKIKDSFNKKNRRSK